MVPWDWLMGGLSITDVPGKPLGMLSDFGQGGFVAEATISSLCTVEQAPLSCLPGASCAQPPLTDAGTSPPEGSGLLSQTPSGTSLLPAET